MNIEDISFITSKTSMQPFDHLNDPIVITMPVYQKQGLWGSSGSTRKTQVGDIFVVYDWESGTVFDWAFFAGKHGLSNWRAVEMGTPTKYYDAGEASGLIGCLDPETGNITVIKNAVHGTFANLNNNNAVKSRYGMIQTSSYSGGYEMYTVNVFDSIANSVSQKKISLQVDSCGGVFTPYADKNGNYWQAYTYDGFNILANYKVNEEKVSVYKLRSTHASVNTDEFTIASVFDHYILLRDDVSPMYENALLYDIDDLSKDPIEIPLQFRISDEDFLCRSVYIENDVYAVFTDRSGSYAHNMIYRLDLESRRFSYLAEFNFDFTETVYVRGTRIYFINSRNLQRFACMYYDTASGTVGEVQSFTFDEIVVQ